MKGKERLIIALDVADLTEAKKLVRLTRDSCSIFKIGLELFLRYGLQGVREIQALGVDIFLDLKLHDIPNTVHASLLQVLPLKPRFITVHASGGAEMLQAAKAALIKTQGQTPTTKVLAVTVLTHLSKIELSRMQIAGSPSEIALKWLHPIRNDRSFGAVCSPQEANFLRSNCSKYFNLVCPGIRPLQSLQNDQTRIATPEEALHNGADYLVIGRPIIRAANPTLAARSVLNEIESVFATHPIVQAIRH